MKFNEYFINEISQAAIQKAIQKFVKAGHDEDEVTELVNSFNDLAEKKKIKSVDIFQLSFDDLKKTVNDAKETTSRSEKDKIIKDKETEFVFENDKVLIVTPLTHQSSCKYGSHTKWCTTNHSGVMWDSYYQKGDKLYYIIPKDGSDKTAVKVDLQGYREVFDATDTEIGDSGMEKVIDKYDIDEDIFEPLDQYDAYERMKMTDEQITDLADDFLNGIGLRGKEAMDIATSMIANFNDYDLGYDYERVIEYARQEIEQWENAFETALDELQQTYGIDRDSDKNKLILLPYVDNDSDEIINSLEERNNVYDMDWDYSSNDGFIEGLGIDFSDRDGLDEKMLENIEEWLTAKYNSDHKQFASFMDDFMEVAKTELRPTEKFSDVIRQQVEDLVNKVGKVSYGKVGHPKLDLQSWRLQMNKTKMFFEDFEKKYTNTTGKVVSDLKEIKKAVFLLKGADSTKATKLAQQLVEIKQKQDELKALKNSCDLQSRELCESLSKAGDEVLTRVMETKKVTISIAGMTQRQDVNWRGAIEQMSDEFAPEVVKQMNKIIKMYTGDPKDVISRVTPKLKGEAFGDWVGKIDAFLQKFVSGIKNWGNSYDQRLGAFQEQYGIE